MVMTMNEDIFVLGSEAVEEMTDGKGDDEDE